MTSFCLLSARLNHVIEQLATFTIIRITDYFMTDIDCKKVLVILELEVVTSGQLVGVKLGNPTRMGFDGKIDPDDGLQKAMDQMSDLQI